MGHSSKLYPLEVKQAISALIPLTSNGKEPTTYSDFGEAIGLHYRSSHLYVLLDQIQSYCSHRGYPSLAVMVGHVGDHYPGETFFTSYANHFSLDIPLNALLVIDSAQQPQTVADFIVAYERSRVAEQDAWSELIDDHDFEEA